MGGNQGNYLEIALARICSHATSLTSRDSENAKLSVNKGAPPFLVCLKKDEPFIQSFGAIQNTNYKRIGYSLDIMRQTACLVINRIIVDGCASLFNCTTAVRVSDSLTASS